jgi:hypothetical protein
VLLEAALAGLAVCGHRSLRQVLALVRLDPGAGRHRESEPGGEEQESGESHPQIVYDLVHCVHNRLALSSLRSGQSPGQVLEAPTTGSRFLGRIEQQYRSLQNSKH